METMSLLDTSGSNSSARNELPLMEFFPLEVSLTCKHCRLSLMFLTPPEVDIKAILQISPVTWRNHVLWLALTVFEATVHATR